MPRKKIVNQYENIENIEEKLEYLGLDLNNIPKILKENKPLEFRISKLYDDKRYRQYRYIPVEDIEILLSPTNRLDDLEDKYRRANYISEYLDSSKEENIFKYTTFLNMIKNVKVEEIEEISREQSNLDKKIPFKVKYEGNYLWQIYYSENSDRYFMIVPTQDSDYSTFFYLLKKQLEKKKGQKIFVPIRSINYSNKYFKRQQFEDIENYLWLFTKDWPSIYEVYDKNDELSIRIIGETTIYENIRSWYKIELKSQEEAIKFYKLLKAIYILQTELPSYFNFKTNINDEGKLEFYIEDKKIQYETIARWINREYISGTKKNNEAEKLIKFDNKKLEQLKLISVEQEIEYIAKEKQISTYLECKKTFIGKVKYFFKYSKKIKKADISQSNEDEKGIEEKKSSKKEKILFNEDTEKKTRHTIEELIDLYKKYEEKENEIKNLVMDINALKLKNKNTKKKIENATMFIEEIDNHKRSIFEFWKYSNKDEVAVLAEGEAEEVNIIKKITKVFDFENDFEEFGKEMDKFQRQVLSQEETDAIYITTTNILDMLNKVKASRVLPQEIDSNLKQLKKEAIENKSLSENDDFDIFGGMAQDSMRISKLADKKHREIYKDRFNILDIDRNTTQIGYKLLLEQIVDRIRNALSKVQITEDISVYKAIGDKTLDEREFVLVNIDPRQEIDETLKENCNNINFYKINLKKGNNAVSCTNIIFYDNQNKTLPVGQNLSNKMLLDVANLNLELINENKFKILELEEKNDFTDVNVKDVNIFEYNIISSEEVKENDKKI